MLRRLTKDVRSLLQDDCDALYATDDPAVLVAQGMPVSEAEMTELIDRAPQEIALRLRTEVCVRSLAKIVTEHGEDDLAAALEAFALRLDRGL